MRTHLCKCIHIYIHMCVYLPICQPSICCRSIFFLSIYLMAACVLLSVLKCSWLLVGVIRCFWQVFGCGRVWKGSEKVSPPPPQKNQNNGWPPGVTCETQICKSAGKIKWNLLQGARTNQKNNKQDPNKNIQNWSGKQRTTSHGTQPMKARWALLWISSTLYYPPFYSQKWL